MTTELRIVIADDHPIVRQGLRQAIENVPELKVVAEAGDGRAALEQLRALKPAIAILDVDMPHLDGFAVARALQAEQLPVEVIFLTIHRDAALLHEALALGAKGYVLKDSAVSDIVTSIRAVAAGDNYISPAMTKHLIARKQQAARLTQQKPGLNDLSPTERYILRLIADYKTSKEIADELGISFRTVETHRSNICRKLEIHGSHALMKFALAHKAELS